jgi:hypothetical protein
MSFTLRASLLALLALASAACDASEQTCDNGGCGFVGGRNPNQDAATNGGPVDASSGSLACGDVSLSTYCCEGPICVTYDECSTVGTDFYPVWSTVPCEGYVVVHLSYVNSDGYFLYDATTHALVAAGATTSSGIDCIAGPPGFVFPQTCGWQDLTPAANTCTSVPDADTQATWVCSVEDGGSD